MSQAGVAGVACVGSRCWRCVGIMSMVFAWVGIMSVAGGEWSKIP